MFRKKEMCQALKWLIGLYQPDDYVAFDEEEIRDDGGLYLPAVSMALRDAAETLYEYTVHGTYERSFRYRGKELFAQRACLLCSDADRIVSDSIISSYRRELWLLEDMTFVVVRCVLMEIGPSEDGYTTEYRCLEKQVRHRDDLFVPPQDLLDELEKLCIPQWEYTATIYEL